MRNVILGLVVILSSGVIFAAEEPPMVAVLSFKAEGLSEVVSDLLRDDLIYQLGETGSFRVLEREHMEEILKEQQFQLTECFDVECAVKIGKLVGAKYVVFGTVAFVGGSYLSVVRMVDIQSGEIVAGARTEQEKTKFTLLAPKLAEELAMKVGEGTTFLTKGDIGRLTSKNG